MHPEGRRLVRIIPFAEEGGHNPRSRAVLTTDQVDCRSPGAQETHMLRDFKRFGHVLWLALRPIPGWNDKVQSALALIALMAPTLWALMASRISSLGNWTVREGALTSVGLLAVAVTVSACRIQKELDAIRDGTPKLVCKGVSFHPNPIVRDSVGRQGSPLTPVITRTIVGVPIFYHLRMANEPAGTVDRKVAEKVAARVQILHENGTPAAGERLHRWEHSPAPSQAGKGADQLLPLDIPPSGIESKLDIAMKYDEDEAFHTPNNETVMSGSKDWREEDFNFPPGNYIAHIRFQGTNVVSTLRCQIINKGKHSKLEITPLPN
jgi:hypothetical protein